MYAIQFDEFINGTNSLKHECCILCFNGVMSVKAIKPTFKYMWGVHVYTYNFEKTCTLIVEVVIAILFHNP